MDLISILATVILATTIGTVVVGVAAYGAFKLRDKRKPKKKASAAGAGDDDAAPVFLTRFEWPQDLAQQASSVPGGQTSQVQHKQETQTPEASPAMDQAIAQSATPGEEMMPAPSSAQADRPVAVGAAH